MPSVITANNPRIGWRTFAVFGTITADTEQADYPASNVVAPQTFSQWRAETNEEQSLYVTTSEPQTADYVAVYGHNWGSKNTTVNIEYSEDGLAWTAATLPSIPDSRDRVFFKEFDPITAAFWRLRLEPAGDLYDDPPEASLFYIGEVLKLPRRIYVGHVPLPLGRSVQLSTGVSTNGQFLGRYVESITNQTGVDMGYLSPEFIRGEFDEFVRGCLDRPFFWTWRPGTYDYEAGLAWYAGSSVPNPSNELPNGFMRVSWNMEGVTLPPHLRVSSSGGGSS